MKELVLKHYPNWGIFKRLGTLYADTGEVVYQINKTKTGVELLSLGDTETIYINKEK